LSNNSLATFPTEQPLVAGAAAEQLAVTSQSAHPGCSTAFSTRLAAIMDTWLTSWACAGNDGEGKADS
jgi:hypothetical protein